MLAEKDVTEGDMLVWDAKNGPVSGIAVKEEGGGMMVYLDIDRAFRLKDLLGSPSLKKTGKVKVK